MFKKIRSLVTLLILLFTAISSKPALSQNGNGTDDKFQLSAFPNPSSSSITINYHLPQSTLVKLMIFSVDGSVGKVLFAGKRDVGAYSETYDVSSLTPGQYFYQLQTETELETKSISMINGAQKQN